MADDTKAYKPALQTARERFKAATARLDDIHAEAHFLAEEISKLRRTITALSAMCSESPGLDSLGITEAVEAVMLEATRVMTSAEVKAALADEGFDLDSQKNATASVHTVLTRMHAAGKIAKTKKMVYTADGKNFEAIGWTGPKYDPDDIPF